MKQSTAPSYLKILQLTWPIILANSTTPLLGLADTAVIGNVAGTAHLGAIALGALLFSVIYWGFGFLRMSTTGFVAQASGRNDPNAIIETFLRALIMALIIGGMLLLLQWPVIEVALSLFGASDEVETICRSYFSIRVWGAPATLGTYVLTGYMIGQGLSRALLLTQLLLNGLNIILDLLFAGHWQMGARGIALGTAIAEWSVFLIATYFVLRHLGGLTDGRSNKLAELPWRQLFVRHKLVPVLHANGNLMVRTLFLLLGFAVFTDQGARFGNTILAANHILLQFTYFSAFFLDGFAFTSESIAGQALGQGDRARFLLAIRRASLLAAGTACLLASSFLLGGNYLLNLLTDLTEVQLTARQYLPWCALYILVSVAAFQLDGLFIGTTTTQPLRNASILSSSSFILLCLVLIPALENHGLWLAFIGFVILRAVFLGAYFRRLLYKISTNPAPESAAKATPDQG